MHSINLFSRSVLAKSVALSSLLVSAMSFAHNGESHQSSTIDHAQMSHEHMAHLKTDHEKMSHTEMDVMPKSMTTHVAAEMDHSMHQDLAPEPEFLDAKSMVAQTHDHRKEHGAQVYAVTTVDNQWLVNEDGNGALKSEFETRIGTDENKVFIKVHADKEESHDAHYDAKILYSRMISDFWDAQVGARYRSEKLELDDHRKDTEEHVDAVIGLHGMAPYFFETDVYLYAGEDSYVGFSLETERDLLITQKLIVQPYLELDVIFSDDSKYAKKTGLSNATVGLETRYEMSKKIMPYLGIGYEYSKGNDETEWQSKSASEQGWLYGAGIRFKF